MEIVDVRPQDKNFWNKFIKAHYPPVGAFMQTWEWGLFQETLGRKIERHLIIENHEPIAVFTLVHHKLPLGFSYGYIPRGPVVAKYASEESKYLEILKTLRFWAQKNLSSLAFIRLEPPLSYLTSTINQHGFYTPSYYIQPKKNHTVLLEKDEQDILAKFHPSTRSNINRAQKRGVTIEIKSKLRPDEYKEFLVMAQDTIRRNNGKNAYPEDSYFQAMLKTIPPPAEIYDPLNLSLNIFFGYQYQRPAAAHFVLYFNNTATYLYGASYSKYLSSKVTTHLHWTAMQKAKRMGLNYYDLGGVDETRWPTLTNFKRQFRGEEINYIGNIDIPLRLFLHQTYDFFRRWKQ